MAKTTLAHNNTYGQDVLRSDIWSRRAQVRMSTARGERRPLNFTSMSSEAARAMAEMSGRDYRPTKDTTQGPSVSRRPKNSAKSKTKHLKSQIEGPKAAADTAEHICSVRLSEVYERLGTEHKLDGDITDPQTWEDDPNQTKFVLGGGKLHNAMEIVEIVNADEPKEEPAVHTSDIDEHVIAEIARINSINKCNVWFEAHESMLGPSASETEDRSIQPAAKQQDSHVKNSR